MKARAFLLSLFLSITQASCVHRPMIGSVDFCNLMSNAKIFSGENIALEAKAAQGINYEIILVDDRCSGRIVVKIREEDEHKEAVELLMSSIFSRRDGDPLGSASGAMIPVTITGKFIWQAEDRLSFLIMDEIILR